MADLFHQLSNITSNAVFSECRRYRYILWRGWAPHLPRIMFIGLNPSTANEHKDDPTIRNVKKLATNWGYGGVYMCNLYAYVTPHPEELMECDDPIANNDVWLRETAAKCSSICFAWGNFRYAQMNDRAAIVAAMFEHAVCCGVNQNGTPSHPLYIPADAQQMKYK